MKDYLEILDTYKEEMVETLRELCRFPSLAEATDPSAESPFGPAVQGALDYMLDKAARDGFAVKNVDNYGGHIDFPGKNATAEDPGDIVALVGHLDVVPVGDLSQWESDPFEMEIRDGKMYGRGTVDDKGPLLAAYFAVRALKEAGFVPEKTIRIMLGCDEETNWDGMEYYFEHMPRPDFGFTPDADFPVLNGEKDYNFTVPDDGEFERALTLDDEFYFTVSARKLDEMMEGIRWFKKIGFGRNKLAMQMELEYPRPQFYDDAMREWGLKTGQLWNKSRS
jgi:predicted dipeptidase